MGAILPECRTGVPSRLPNCSYWQLDSGKLERSELRQEGGMGSAVHIREYPEKLPEVTGGTLLWLCAILFQILF